MLGFFNGVRVSGMIGFFVRFYVVVFVGIECFIEGWFFGFVLWFIFVVVLF